MERFLSTGVATIVALMAAHRAAPGRDDQSTTCCQDEIIQIQTGLFDTKRLEAQGPCKLGGQPAHQVENEPNPTLVQMGAVSR